MAREFNGKIPFVPIDADTSKADKKVDALFNKIKGLQHINIDANISNLQRRLETMAKRTNEQMTSGLMNNMVKDFKTVLGAMKTEAENNGIDTVIYKSLEKTAKIVEDRFENLTVSIGKKQLSGLEQILNGVSELESISDFKFGEIVSKQDVKNLDNVVRNMKDTKKELKSITSKIEYINKILDEDVDSALSEQKLKNYKKKVLELQDVLQSFSDIDNPLIKGTVTEATIKAANTLNQISQKQAVATKKQAEAQHSLSQSYASTTKSLEKRLKLSRRVDEGAPKNQDGQYVTDDGLFEIDRDAEGWKVHRKNAQGLFEYVGVYKTLNDIRADGTLIAEQEARAQEKAAKSLIQQQEKLVDVRETLDESIKKSLKLSRVKGQDGKNVPETYSAVNGKYLIEKGSVGWNVYDNAGAGYGELIGSYETLKQLREDADLIAEQEVKTQERLAVATKEATDTQAAERQVRTLEQVNAELDKEKGKLAQIEEQQRRNDAARAAFQKKRENYSQEFGSDKPVYDTDKLKSAANSLREFNTELDKRNQFIEKYNQLCEIIEKSYVGPYSISNGLDRNLEDFINRNSDMRELSQLVTSGIKGVPTKHINELFRSVVNLLTTEGREIGQLVSSGDVLGAPVTVQLAEEEVRLGQEQQRLHDEYQAQLTKVNDLKSESLELTRQIGQVEKKNTEDIQSGANKEAQHIEAVKQDVLSQEDQVKAIENAYDVAYNNVNQLREQLRQAREEQEKLCEEAELYGYTTGMSALRAGKARKTLSMDSENNDYWSRSEFIEYQMSKGFVPHIFSGDRRVLSDGGTAYALKTKEEFEYAKYLENQIKNLNVVFEKGLEMLWDPDGLLKAAEDKVTSLTNQLEQAERAKEDAYERMSYAHAGIIGDDAIKAHKIGLAEKDRRDNEISIQQMQETAKLIGDLQNKYSDRFESIFGSLGVLNVENAKQIYDELIAKEQTYISELKKRTLTLQEFVQENQEALMPYQKVDGFEQRFGELSAAILQDGLSKDDANKQLSDFINSLSTDGAVEENKLLISSYEDLYQALEKVVDLSKQLKPEWTAEFSSMSQMMDRAGHPESKEDLISEIKAQYDNVKRIKTSIKNGLSVYKYADGRGYEAEYDIDKNTLSEAETILRAYIYQAVEHFGYTVADVMNDFDKKRVRAFVEDRINEYLDIRDKNDKYQIDAETFNAPIKETIESIISTIQNMAIGASKSNEVDDLLYELQNRSGDVNRYTLSAQSNYIGSAIGIQTPYDEIRANAKKIESYEELCDVVTRYNELQKDSVIFGGTERPGLDEDAEMERKLLAARLEATGGKDIYKLSSFYGFDNVDRLATVLGIETPQSIEDTIAKEQQLLDTAQQVEQIMQDQSAAASKVADELEEIEDAQEDIVKDDDENSGPENLFEADAKKMVENIRKAAQDGNVEFLKNIVDSKDLTTELTTAFKDAYDSIGEYKFRGDKPFTLNQGKKGSSLGIALISKDESKTLDYVLALEDGLLKIQQTKQKIGTTKFDKDHEIASANAEVDNLISKLKGRKLDGVDALRGLANNIVDSESLQKFNNELDIMKKKASTLSSNTVSGKGMNTLANSINDMENATITVDTYRKALNRLGDVDGVAQAAAELDKMSAAAERFQNATNQIEEEQAFSDYSKAESKYKAWNKYAQEAKREADIEANTVSDDSQKVKNTYDSIFDTVNKINSIDKELMDLGGKNELGVYNNLILQLKAEKEQLVNALRDTLNAAGQEFGNGIIQGNQTVSGARFFTQEDTNNLNAFIQGVGLGTEEVDKLNAAFMQSDKIGANAMNKIATSMNNVQGAAKGIFEFDENGFVTGTKDGMAMGSSAFNQALNAYREYQQEMRNLSQQDIIGANTVGIEATEKKFLRYAQTLGMVIQTEQEYFAGRNKYSGGGLTMNSLVPVDKEYLKHTNKVYEREKELREKAQQFAKESETSGAIVTNFVQGADGIARLDFSVLDKGTDTVRKFRMEMDSAGNVYEPIETTVNSFVSTQKVAQKQFESISDLIKNVKNMGGDSEALNRLIAVRDKLDAELSQPSGGDSSVLAGYIKDAKLAAAEVEKLYKKHQQLQNAVDSGEATAKALDMDDDIYKQMTDRAKEFISKHGGVNEKIGKFNSATGQLRFTMETTDGTVQEFIVSLDRLGKQCVTQQIGVTQLKSKWEQFKDGLSKTGKEFMTAFAGMNIFYEVLAQLRQGYQYVKEIDLAMTELKKVTNETDMAYDNFLGTASKRASAIGSTVSDFAEATANFARLGYTMDESAKMAETAIVYKNVADGLDTVEESTDSIISTMKAFGIEADDTMSIIDRFNEVGNNFAITSAGIGEALQRSASALFEAGNTIDESIALVTAANSVIQNPEQVGELIAHQHSNMLLVNSYIG